MAACSSTLPEKLLKGWSSKGKEEALVLFQKAHRRGSMQNAVEGSLEFRSLLYDLLKNGVYGSLESEDVGGFLTELATTLDISDTLQSILADVLSVLDAEVACGESKEQRSAFKALVSACMSLVGEGLLKERLDMDTLEGVGLVQSKVTFNQKYVKTKTKLYYKQQKFNLFHEENEGYSKLIAELSQEGRPDSAAPALLEHVKSLIGRFNLDPNRVLDVMLEAFECHLDETGFFLPFLAGYPCQPLSFVNILGFKFQCYHTEDTLKTPATPSSLYKMAALLLHEGLVKLEDLYPHLSLTDSQLKEFHTSEFEDAKAQAKKATVLTLNDKTDEEREKELEAERERKENRAAILSPASNQKLGLCLALLELGDWKQASALMKFLPPRLPMWSTEIAKSLCSLIDVSIEPLYRNTCCPRGAKGSSPSPSCPEGIRQCSSFTDLPLEVFDMLYSLGPHVHSSPVLLAKVLRVGKVFLKERAATNSNGELPAQEMEDVFHGFISVLDEIVLPSLSLMHCNCAMAEEVWSVLRQLPYETRYQLYGHWKNSSYHSHPQLIEVRAQVIGQGKYVMKRLTRENVKPSGRQIGKYSHCNPCIIFEYVLSQIQLYDNFIIPVVDSLKYLTPLAYDVLAFCIIEALGNPQRERMKHDDTNISQWLQGLASFSANVFKKYSIELTGLLQYVTNQLKAGKSFDLLVLKEVVQKMSGVDVTEEMTSSQLEALAGGELLKAEGGSFFQVRNTKKSSQRLREALMDGHLSLPLCLLMAQQRDCIIFKEGAQQHLKLLGMLYDQCLDTLVQFGGFLSSHLDSDEYSSRIPSLNALGTEYHVPADVAFFLLRPLLSNNIGEKFRELEKASKSVKEKPDKRTKALQQETSYQEACLHVIEPITEAVKVLHSPRVWEDISPRLYSIFWAFSLYDLYVPSKRYEEEIKKAQQAIHQLEDNFDMTSSKRKKEQERSTVLIDKLNEEFQRQENNHRLVMSWLRQEKDHWFSPKVTKNRTITQFLQLCIFPRCRFTAPDAVFCAKFVNMLHSLQAPNFSTLLFFDRVFSDISYTVASCTENEVRRYGQFLGALLEIVSRWHSSESIYGQECAKTPGFISMMRSSGSGNEKQFLDYENYRHITFKWHFKLTKSLVVLLESKDYMQVRNGLIVLTKVLPHYPKVYHLSIALEKRIEKIMEEEKEKRQDLYALAMGYFGMLKYQKQNLVPESEFHNRDERVKAQQSEGETKSGTNSKGDKDREKEKAVTANGITGTPEEKQAKGSRGKEGKITKSKGEDGKPKAPRDSTGAESGKERKSKDESPKEKAKESGTKPSSAATPVQAKHTAQEKAVIKEKKGEGKNNHKESGGVVSMATAGGLSEPEPSPTAKAGGQVPSSSRNGPVASPGQAGQRRQHSRNVSPVEVAAEKDTKRRKLDDGTAKSTKADEHQLRDKEVEVEEKRVRAKRDRSSDKESGSEAKRKKALPESAPATEVVEAKEKVSRRVVKVSKKEGKVTLDVSTAAPRKGATAKDEDPKVKKHHSNKVKAIKK